MQPSERLEPGSVTEARLVEMVFPEQTNHYGTLFGGQALALMDKAAFVVASRYARRNVVTASSEKVDFHVPVRQGQLVELVTRVVATGRTSMTLEVDLYAEDLLTGERQLGTRGRFIFVALDAHGRPTAVPPLEPPRPGRAALPEQHADMKTPGGPQLNGSSSPSATKILAKPAE